MAGAWTTGGWLVMVRALPCLAADACGIGLQIGGGDICLVRRIALLGAMPGVDEALPHGCEAALANLFLLYGVLRGGDE